MEKIKKVAKITVVGIILILLFFIIMWLLRLGYRNIQRDWFLLEFNHKLLVIILISIALCYFFSALKNTKNIDLSMKNSFKIIMKIFAVIIFSVLGFTLFGIIYRKILSAINRDTVVIIALAFDFIGCSIVLGFVLRKLCSISFSLVVCIMVYIFPLAVGILNIPVLGSIAITEYGFEKSNFLLWSYLLLLSSYIDKSAIYIFRTLKKEIIDDIYNL